MGKKCHVCKKVLKGLRSRFCTDHCYKIHKSIRAKNITLRNRNRFSDKECTICKKTFKPIREDHYACSKECGRLQASQRIIKKRKSIKKLPRVNPIKKLLPIKVQRKVPLKIELVTSAKFHSSDKTKDEVLAFLENGGKITKFPDEPRAKTPDVNVPFGHTMSEISGFGMEFNIDDSFSSDYDIGGVNKDVD